MKKICSLGGATKDIFIMYEGAETLHLHTQKGEASYLLLEQGTKIDIPALHYATGGGATNAAVSFKRLGLDVKAFFKVGTDVAGEFVHAEMSREKIDISLCLIDPQTSTALSFIIPSLEHNNVALCYRGANTKLTVDEFPFSCIKEFDYLYISPLSGRSGRLLPALVAEAKKHDIPVATNPGMVQITRDVALFNEALSGISILIVNAHEATHLMKSLLKITNLTISKSKKETIQGPRLLKNFASINDTMLTVYDYFNEILKKGPSIGVVTNGVEGVYVATHETLYFHPSLKTEVVSGLGAGDAFSAAFIGSLAMGKSIEDAILYGVINAHSVLQFADAKEGILTADELEKRAQALGKEKLLKIPR